METESQDYLKSLDQLSKKIQERTGRDLILAIIVGLALGLAVMFSLLYVKEIFIVVLAIGLAFGSFEFATALRVVGRDIPRFVTVVSTVLIVLASFWYSAPGQLAALGISIVLLFLWRGFEVIRPNRGVAAADFFSDVGTSILLLLYVPFLGSFAALTTSLPGGELWVLAMVILVVTSDTAAYAVGLMFGKTPFAPKISPKKTWEGFFGSVVFTAIAGILLGVFMLNIEWWQGIIYGLAMVGTATTGDLFESLLKRNLGVKDMGSSLPGHGGFMERLDSMLPSCLLGYALCVLFI